MRRQPESWERFSWWPLSPPAAAPRPPQSLPAPTFEEEGLVPVRVQVLALHLGLQLVLLVGEQVDLDEGVAGAAEVLGRQLLGLHDLDGQGGLLEVVADAELDAAQVLPAGAIVALVVLGAR